MTLSTTDRESERREALLAGELPVGVYGLGKMGLPLAAVYAEVTGNVLGADVDPSVVESIEAGECHVTGEPGLPELVAELVAKGALSASTDPRSVASEVAIHVVIVPTLIDEDHVPDMSILESVIRDVGSGLDAGDLVVIESTVPPRTCADVVYPLLCEVSGLAAGEFGLAFCPERTSSGRALEDIRGAYPKVVGGIDDVSTAYATGIYEEINEQGVIPVSDTTTAEAVKVFEGLYRDVNIALANELARFTDELGIDVNEAIEVANTQPFCDIHQPGPGVGGHCIPYYPYFMIEPFETGAPLLETARAVNDGMPAFVVGKVEEELAAAGRSVADADVLVLGVTYRPGISEIRATPAKPITEELSARGARVFAVDPHWDDFDVFEASELGLEDIYDQEFDVVVLVTPHEEFDSIKWDALNPSESELFVIDGRGTLDPAGMDHRVYTIGSGYDV